MMNLTFAQKASNREKTVRELTSDRDRVASLLENQKRLTQAEKAAKKAAQEESKIQKKKDLEQKITIKHLNDQIAQKDAAFKAMVASLTAKLTQAGAHDKADHDAIHNLNEQLAKESDERQKLGKLLNDKKDELATKTGELEILQGQLKETEKTLEASQTLVKSQEKEIATANAAKDAANGQVGRLEAVLEQAQKHAATLKTDLEAAKKNVERLNAENTEAAARISNLEWEIITVKAAEKNTQKELTQAKDNVQNVQNELNTTKEKLLEIEESERKYMQLYENQQAQAELHEQQDRLHEQQDTLHEQQDTLHAQQDTLHAQQDTKHIRKDELIADFLATSLGTRLEASDDAYKKLQNEHSTLIQNTTEKVTQLERKLETTNKELTDAKEQLKNNAIQADKMAGELDEKLKKAQSTLTSVEGRLIKPAEHRKNERINIASVEYGGKAYTEDTDRAVYDRLYKMARENSAEVMSNTFFGGDPWVGIRKSFAVTYQVGGKGKLTLGYGYENAIFRFNLEAKN